MTPTEKILLGIILIIGGGAFAGIALTCAYYSPYDLTERKTSFKDINDFYFQYRIALSILTTLGSGYGLYKTKFEKNPKTFATFLVVFMASLSSFMLALVVDLEMPGTTNKWSVCDVNNWLGGKSVLGDTGRIVVGGLIFLSGVALVWSVGHAKAQARKKELADPKFQARVAKKKGEIIGRLDAEERAKKAKRAGLMKRYGGDMYQVGDPEIYAERQEELSDYPEEEDGGVSGVYKSVGPPPERKAPTRTQPIYRGMPEVRRTEYAEMRRPRTGGYGEYSGLSLADPSTGYDPDLAPGAAGYDPVPDFAERTHGYAAVV